MIRKSLRLFVLLALFACAAFAHAADEYQGKPYKGAPQAIPGRVQAELYDEGGQGVAYGGVDAANNGSGKLNIGNTQLDRFRQGEGVGIFSTKSFDKDINGAPEKQGELYLGRTAPGEWFKYTVDVKTAGMYRIDAHLSSKTKGAEMSLVLQAASNASTGTVILPSTGDWHTWRMVENIGTVRLNKGLTVMTLSVLKGGEFNIDYFELVPVAEGASAFTPIDPFEQVKQMRRGVNIVGYDPIWKDFSQRRFQERHFQRVREAGFQTVRVNLQAFQHMDSLNRLSPAWVKTMDWVIDNALANHLTVILDEHDYEPCAKDAEYCRGKLVAFWEQVAARYKDTPNSVVFEILNEPNTALDNQTWNALLKNVLALIRRTNPKRNVILGPAFWNSYSNLNTLELPAGDRNIIVTVHYYKPEKFTHQGAYWSKETMHLSGIKWGTDAEKQAVNNDFEGVQQWSKANNRPILLGEFGSYDKGDMESRATYTAYVARTAESLNWAWAYWQFDADFIVYDIEKDQWVEPLRKALTP